MMTSTSVHVARLVHNFSLFDFFLLQLLFGCALPGGGGVNNDCGKCPLTLKFFKAVIYYIVVREAKNCISTSRVHTYISGKKSLFSLPIGIAKGKKAGLTLAPGRKMHQTFWGTKSFCSNQDIMWIIAFPRTFLIWNLLPECPFQKLLWYSNDPTTNYFS